MVIGWLDQGLWPLFQWMFVDAGNPVLQFGPFSGRPFESCRLVHGKYPIPLKMNDDYMRLMLWAVQLVMFGWIDASPTSVVSALLMWWFRRISMDPGIPDCVETTGRRSCHSVLKAMNQLFTFSVAVTDVVIAARKSAKHSTDSPVLKQPVQFWDKKIKKKFGTMLCFGRFCWVLANFPTTKVTLLKITSNPWRIGTGGVAAHALIADCRAVPQKKTKLWLFWCRKWPGLHLCWPWNLQPAHFHDVLVGFTINIYQLCHLEVSENGGTSKSSIWNCKPSILGCSDFRKPPFLQEPSIDTNVSVLAAFKASPARFQIATVGRTAADTGSRDMQRQETRCGKLESWSTKSMTLSIFFQKDTGLQRMGWALHLLVETHWW